VFFRIASLMRTFVPAERAVVERCWFRTALAVVATVSMPDPRSGWFHKTGCAPYVYASTHNKRDYMHIIFYIVACLIAAYGWRAESPTLGLMAWTGALAICGVAQWCRVSRRRRSSAPVGRREPVSATSRAA